MTNAEISSETSNFNQKPILINQDGKLNFNKYRKSFLIWTTVAYIGVGKILGMARTI